MTDKRLFLICHSEPFVNVILSLSKNLSPSLSCHCERSVAISLSSPATTGIATLLTLLAMTIGWLLDADNHDAKDDEHDSQGDGKLHHGFFHTPPRPVDAFRLSEYTSQPAAPHLHRNYHNQGYSYQNLGNN
jgi:hypothetical protein